MVEAAVVTALGIIWILCRFNIKRIAGYATFWDITLTVVLTLVFVGTFAGMVTGMMAGLIVSIFLSGVKRTVGAERLKLIRKEGEMTPKLRWKEVQ